MLLLLRVDCAEEGGDVNGPGPCFLSVFVLIHTRGNRADVFSWEG